MSFVWSRAQYFRMAKLMTKHTLFDREWFADKLGSNKTESGFDKYCLKIIKMFLFVYMEDQ